MAKYIFHEEKRNAQEKKAEEISEVHNSSFILLKMILIVKVNLKESCERTISLLVHMRSFVYTII